MATAKWQAEKVEQLAKIIVEKIEQAAADGSLAAHPSFTGIVWHWQLFGHGDKAAEWMRQLAQSDEQLVKSTSVTDSFN